MNEKLNLTEDYNLSVFSLKEKRGRRRGVLCVRGIISQNREESNFPTSSGKLCEEHHKNKAIDKHIDFEIG